ncbi:MAG: DUF5677 domain-containing protein [Candidatus Paceibacterota bacterium]|jgi:hypothetical protein
MSLTAKNLKIVESFNYLKTQINSLLDNNLKGKTHLQNYLYFVVAPVFNYTESIIILCDQGKFNAASVLLRSLIEAHINIIYYQINDTEKKLSMAVKKQFDWRKKSVNLFINLIKKYPNLESPKENSSYNIKNLEKKFKKIDEARNDIISINKLKEGDKDLNLYDKAISCDNAKIEKAEPGHFELIHRLFYNILSTYVHLDIPGLESFVGKNDDGKYFFKDETANEDLLISQSIDICIALIKDLYENKVIMGDPPESLNIIEKLLNK